MSFVLQSRGGDGGRDGGPDSGSSTPDTMGATVQDAHTIAARTFRLLQRVWKIVRP